MKKILSLVLAALLLVSMIPTAIAADTNPAVDGTTIKLVGSKETIGESYTVTVPAELQPGQEGWVSARGNWSSKQTLMVSCPNSVTLTYGDQTMTVNITSADYGGENGVLSLIEWVGSDTEVSSVDGHIKVEEASALFGTWIGHLTYTVEMVTEESGGNGEMIAFTVIGDQCEAVAGITWEEFKNGDYSSNWTIYFEENSNLVYVEMAGEPLVTEEGEYVKRTDLIIADHAYESKSMPSFSIYDHRVTEDDDWEPKTYYFETDMTWAEWVSSPYNTGGYNIGEYDGTQYIMLAGNNAVYSNDDGFVQPSEKIAADISEYRITFVG